MKRRGYELYLQDIRDAIDKIEIYTRNLSFQKFSHDRMAIDAVVRNLEIIGEATKNIPHKIKLCGKRLKNLCLN